MSESTSSWLKGCAAGCGGLVLLVVVGLGIIGVRTCVPLRSADRDLDALEARFGPPGAFTPSADGSIPDDRLRTFLSVRRGLEETCREFSAMLVKMGRVDAIDEAENPTGAEIAETSKGLAGVSIDIAPAVGRFFERRNAALLEAGMGLGEYSYIYALAYADELAEAERAGGVFFDEHVFAPHVQERLRAVFVHQLEAVRETGPPALAAGLEREIHELSATPGRLPWPDGLPLAATGSFAARRDELDRGYCSATAGIELDRTSGRALRLALY